jgi:two-component sensor histidine kinase
MKKRKPIIENYYILLLSGLFGGAVWLIDATLDYFIFYPGLSFIELLATDIPEHELYIRLVILAIFLSFGMFAQKRVLREKETSEKLTEMIAERDLLLRELNHRVKNNLQVINGIIDLKRRNSETGETMEVLTEIRSGCESIAAAHKLLYREGGWNSISLDRYVRDFARRMADMLQGDREIEVRVETDEITVDIDTAIPCGLVLNELMLNAFRHAFPGDRRGLVDISLKNSVNNGFELRVSDNGIGMPPESEAETAPGLGLKLVRGLVRQIGAEIEFERNHGTSAVLSKGVKT